MEKRTVEPVHYYFSGIGNFSPEQKIHLSLLCKHRLQSCHREYFRSTEDWLYYASQNNKQSTILLDSGAFTAWSKGNEIKIDKLLPIYDSLVTKYADTLKELWLINLDKIPGQRGRTATPDEIDEAIRISDENFKILVKHFGNRVLPVFHQNESKERLHDVCAMSDYICVSPRNDVGEKYRISWAAEVHTLLKKEPRKIRTHGLATTGMHMLRNTDWYSADSAWWMATANNGSIMYLHENGDIKTVPTSDRAGSKKDLEQHFSTLNPTMQAYILGRLEKHGFTYENVATHHTPRQLMCIYEVIEWLKVSETKPIHYEGLFDL